MSIVTVTSEGHRRPSVGDVTTRRAALLAAGCQPTTWADYVVYKTPSNRSLFITIRKIIHIADGHGRLLETRSLDRALECIKDQP
jgi:hypothetical protein